MNSLHAGLIYQRNVRHLAVDDSSGATVKIEQRSRDKIKTPESFLLLPQYSDDVTIIQ